MSDHVFRSEYSMEEIENNFKDVDFFSGIKEGLEEALAYEKGKASLETIARKKSLPDVNVKAERESLGMTQKAFANVLGVSKRTVESWETGRNTPSPTAKNLIYLISQKPDLVLMLQEARCEYSPRPGFDPRKS